MQIFLRIFPFKHGKKSKLSEYFSARFEIVILCLKEKFSMNFCKNALKQQKGIV